MSEAFLTEVDQLVRARYTLLYLVTWEERRARKLLGAVATQQHKSLFEWSITDGLRKVFSGTQEQFEKTKRLREPMAVLNEILQNDIEAIYILKDFHNYLKQPEIVRQLRDLGFALRRTKKTIVILSPTLEIHPDIEKSVTIVDLPLPSYKELRHLLTDKIAGSSKTGRYTVDLNERELDTMVKAAQGLTLIEAENAFARAIVNDSKLDGQDIPAILAEKKQVIRKSGVLEYCDATEQLTTVGGMDILKDWLKKRVRAFGDDARAYGLPQPRGILLMGVQGCGKSLVAKTIALSWRLPLLRLDMSRIFQGYIGSSEENMRKAVRIAESIAPVVLWVDEIEKAFSGVESSGASDSGTTSRVVGTFLTWMQEKTAPVFIAATANDVKQLPPELLRKGRLDEIFFVDLPNEADRTEILRIHLAKKNRTPEKFDIERLSGETEGFSGAELEQAVISALHDSFFDKREVTTDDIINSVRETVPLSTTMREKVEGLREWSRVRARPVSTSQSGFPSRNSHE